MSFIFTLQQLLGRNSLLQQAWLHVQHQDVSTNVCIILKWLLFGTRLIK
jgi:hypothetical protein